MDPVTLLTLQQAQRAHDKRFDTRVMHASRAQMLQHYGLRVAVQAARLAQDKPIKPILVESLAVALAIANELNVDLSQRVDLQAQPPLRDMIAVSGDMAKACDEIDHLGDFPIRKTIEAASVNLTTIVVAEAARRTLDIAALMDEHRSRIASTPR